MLAVGTGFNLGVLLLSVIKGNKDSAKSRVTKISSKVNSSTINLSIDPYRLSIL